MDDFDIFWAHYPKRVAKADARKAWKQLSPDRETIQKIHDALAWQVRQESWLRDGGQYIPYPASWLRGERFEDEQFKPVAPVRVEKCFSCGNPATRKFSGAYFCDQHGESKPLAVVAGLANKLRTA